MEITQNVKSTKAFVRRTVNCVPAGVTSTIEVLEEDGFIVPHPEPVSDDIDDIQKHNLRKRRRYFGSPDFYDKPQQRRGVESRAVQVSMDDRVKKKLKNSKLKAKKLRKIVSELHDACINMYTSYIMLLERESKLQCSSCGKMQNLEHNFSDEFIKNELSRLKACLVDTEETSDSSVQCRTNGYNEQRVFAAPISSNVQNSSNNPVASEQPDIIIPLSLNANETNRNKLSTKNEKDPKNVCKKLFRIERVESLISPVQTHNRSKDFNVGCMSSRRQEVVDSVHSLYCGSDKGRSDQPTSSTLQPIENDLINRCDFDNALGKLKTFIAGSKYPNTEVIPSRISPRKKKPNAKYDLNTFVINDASRSHNPSCEKRLKGNDGVEESNIVQISPPKRKSAQRNVEEVCLNENDEISRDIATTSNLPMTVGPQEQSKDSGLSHTNNTVSGDVFLPRSDLVENEPEPSPNKSHRAEFEGTDLLSNMIRMLPEDRRSYVLRRLSSDKVKDKMHA